MGLTQRHSVIQYLPVSPHCNLSFMPALWMLLSCLLFACMGVCVKLASASFSTGEVVFYRGIISMLMMVGLARSQGIR